MEDNIQNQEVDTQQEVLNKQNKHYKIRIAILLTILTAVIGFTVTADIFQLAPKQKIIPKQIPNNAYVDHKPAIYLYPEKTTQISVKLDDSIKYINVIPKHTKNGWLVEAEPNGVLRDLQPKYTNCKKLPYKEFGFEYSKFACEINKYPYIYWDGIQTKKPLPIKNEGFIVDNENIEQFLSLKADEVGFNSEEKKEFVRYWTKTAKETNWKKFKIYFLQNEELDSYMPIYVEPKPVNSNRISIIIEKAKRNEKLQEQKLTPFKRDNYTLVEWGGIITK